jgi:hypothetical protein
VIFSPGVWAYRAHKIGQNQIDQKMHIYDFLLLTENGNIHIFKRAVANSVYLKITIF